MVNQEELDQQDQRVQMAHRVRPEMLVNLVLLVLVDQQELLDSLG